MHNHIGTVHAIALCNGLEAAMGALAEASIPRTKRWIPKGMTVHYTAKADSDITCIAETNPEQWTSDDPDLPVRVRGVRVDGTVVIEGEIRLWVTDKLQNRPECSFSYFTMFPKVRQTNRPPFPGPGVA
ncbi:MAG: hotdog fold domain-containing protein [Marmoricola sp.]